jgi:hypothetical protein
MQEEEGGTPGGGQVRSIISSFLHLYVFSFSPYLCIAYALIVKGEKTTGPKETVLALETPAQKKRKQGRTKGSKKKATPKANSSVNCCLYTIQQTTIAKERHARKQGK